MAQALSMPRLSQQVHGTMADDERKVYFVKCCPRSTECTKSFKDAKVWGYTGDKCIERLAQHYENSGNHRMSRQDARDRAEEAQLEYSAYLSQHRQRA